MKSFIFTIDDNIRFLDELTKTGAESIFSHPYAKMLKDLHETFNVKVQLNLFYENSTFNLSKMTDKYYKEWEENADWLKLSFHSRVENVCPYKDSSFEEVYTDCANVKREILRFAGEKSLATTTTVHYCQTTNDGLNALKDNGVKGLLGLYGTENEPTNSYNTDLDSADKIRKGEVVLSDGIYFSGIDIVLNCFSIEENLELLKPLLDRRVVKIMIHEQYFYKDYFLYQSDFKQKLEKAFSCLIESGFKSCFYEEIL